MEESLIICVLLLPKSGGVLKSVHGLETSNAVLAFSVIVLGFEVADVVPVAGLLDIRIMPEPT